MGSPENANWLLDCPLADEIPAGVGDLAAAAPGGFCWAPRGYGGTAVAGVRGDGSSNDSYGLKEVASRKRTNDPHRTRSESSAGPSSKACTEKLRRDKLNDRFLELGAILEPGKPPKMDKAAVLSDAVRLVIQLRGEAQGLKESNESLREKIRELKADKNELRDEKQKLKAEKESLERQTKALAPSARPGFVPHPPMIPAAFPVRGPNQNPAASKLVMPVIGSPGYPMWQYMPPADVDTAQDADSCPPVA